MSSTSTGPGSSRVTVELPELSDTERVEYPEFLVSYRSISGDGTTGPWLDGGRVNSDSGRVTLPENLSDGSYEFVFMVHRLMVEHGVSQVRLLRFPLPV